MAHSSWLIANCSYEPRTMSYQLSTMSQAAVSFDHVSKRYRVGQFGYRTLREDIYDLSSRLIRLRKDSDQHYIWALKDVTFQVNEGETLGIIGRNGAGKTTILRLLAGITKPTEGKISVKGRMGVLIELAAGFHPELTGGENIYLNGSILGMSKKEIDRKFDAIVDFAEFKDFLDTPVKRYSSGMTVRLAFSVAVHVDPEVLLVDEVLAVGDLAFQAKCYERMEKLLSQGCALVFVSHNMVVMQRMCKRVIWLERGQIREEGETGSVCNSYTNYMVSSSSDVTVGSIRIPAYYSDPGVSLKSVEVSGRHSAEINKVLLGDECTIRVVFETRKRLTKPAFVIGIRREDDFQLAVLNSKAQGDSCDFEGIGVVKCTLPNLPFLPGVYYLGLRILEGDGPGTLLFAHNAGQFRVTAESPDWMLSQIGAVLPYSEWAFE
jgi:lipopolysaccharide transport system ATP-binding protein